LDHSSAGTSHNANKSVTRHQTTLNTQVLHHTFSTYRAEHSDKILFWTIDYKIRYDMCSAIKRAIEFR